MRVLTGPYQEWTPLPGAPTAITIGVLDGVHLGHRALIDKLDGDLVKTVLTFEPHPVEVLKPGTNPRLITLIDERLELLARAGVDQVGILDLAEIKSLAPDEFVESVLVGTLNMGRLVVGHDFRFGRDRSGNVALLERLARAHRFALETIGLVSDSHGPVSSSRIRDLIESGNPRQAAAGMGSRFTVTSQVVRGESRGALIGFPTANLIPPERKVIPGSGIYAAFARVGGSVHPAAVSVGVRPTFGPGELLIEAYLLDFQQDIYGEDLTVELVDYLRPELRFDTVGELVERMREDVAESRLALASTTPSMG